MSSLWSVEIECAQGWSEIGWVVNEKLWVGNAVGGNSIMEKSFEIENFYESRNYQIFNLRFLKVLAKLIEGSLNLVKIDFPCSDSLATLP